MAFCTQTSTKSQRIERNNWSYKTAKMAKYTIFWKILAKKHCFGNKWQSTTFSRTRVSETRVPY